MIYGNLEYRKKQMDREKFLQNVSPVCIINLEISRRQDQKDCQSR